MYGVHPLRGSAGKQTETSTVWQQMKYLVIAMLLWQQFSLRAAAAATPPPTRACYILRASAAFLRALISFHEISRAAERDESSFREAEKKGVDVEWAQLASWVLTEEAVFDQTHREVFVLASSHPDGLYCSSAPCVAITDP